MQYAYAPSLEVSTSPAALGLVWLFGLGEGYIAGTLDMELPILALDLSHIPKSGVDAGSDRAHNPPLQGRRRRTSSDVRLVCHLPGS